MSKKMNHAAYQAKCRTMSYAELEYACKDALETVKANPNGENAGYYMDEVHYCRAELNRRNAAFAK